MVATIFAVLLQAGREECAALVESARQDFASRRFDTARASLERALPACLDAAPIHVSLGQIDYLQGREVEAEAQFKKALSLKPADRDALYALGRLYYQQHRYPEAAGAFEKIVTGDPKHYRAHDNLALCYDALQRDADALRHFFRALDLVMKDHPTYDWAHANLADFFLKRNEFDKAFQLAQEAARRNPESARNAFLTGKALARLGKEDFAVRWLEQAVKLDAAHSESWYLLAQIYRKLGRPEQASLALEKFRALGKESRPRR